MTAARPLTDPDWQADLERSALGRSAWREQSMWALWVYRFGRRAAARCTLRHGVTLGVRDHDGACPVLEDDVELGADAQVFGGVRLSRGCRVSAISVVLHDMPPGTVVVGNPARIVRQAGASPAPIRGAEGTAAPSAPIA